MMLKLASWLLLATTALAFHAPVGLLRSLRLAASVAEEPASVAEEPERALKVSAAERKLAIEDTAKWCRERCLEGGHCEALEDMCNMSTAQVQSFCKACILEAVNTNDECDISFLFTPDAPWGPVEAPLDVVEKYGVPDGHWHLKDDEHT
mmetsp:Transcript_23100/g.70976  ORF Transcript_23100/g.70976 Transcript_23100/m.70976 type:complete len:150 (+) Transcript_23100:66-515(+)